MAGGIWEGYDRGVAANRAQSLGALQQAQAVQGILAQQQQQELRAQAMQQEQRVRGILSDPNIAPQDKERALMSLGRPGLEALNTMGQINDRNAMAVERTSIARQRDEQAAQLRRNAGREATQQGALERLQGVLSPLPATPETGGITSQPFVGSPSEADAEAIRRYTANPNQPMRMNVVDPNEVQRLALAADPKAGVASLLKQAAPGGIKDMATPVAQGYLTRGPDGRPVFNRTYEQPAQRPTFVPGAAQPTLLEGGVARPVVDQAGTPVQPVRPASGTRRMSADERRTINEVDSAIEGGKQALKSIETAMALNDKAMGFYGAGKVSTLGTLMPETLRPKVVDATENLHNVIIGTALPQLRSIFGGNPTEGERRVLLELAGSVDKNPSVRREIFQRAMETANARMAHNREKLQGLRAGTFYQAGATGSYGGEEAADAQPADAAPARVRRYNPATGKIE